MHFPELADRLHNPTTPIARALQQFATAYAINARNVTECAVAVKDAVGLTEPKFAGHGQQDSHEFLVHLETGLENVPGDPLGLFRGRVQSGFTCNECGTCTGSEQTFLSWELAMPNQYATLDLQRCIDAFFATEDLEFRCDVCKKMIEGRRGSVILEFGQILVIHLLRFEKVVGPPVKIDTPIRYPFQLELPEAAGRVNYILRGVVMHSGNLDGGHYTALLLENQNSAWRCNDSYVERTRQIQDPSAYVLFYQRLG
jgi:ubiquitin C-terminal hydrolase